MRKKKPKLKIDDTLPGINAYYQDGCVYLSYKASMQLTRQELRALIRHELAHHYQWHGEIFLVWIFIWVSALLITPSLFGFQYEGLVLLSWMILHWCFETILEVSADCTAKPEDMLTVLEMIGTDTWKVKIRKLILKGRAWKKA